MRLRWLWGLVFVLAAGPAVGAQEEPQITLPLSDLFAYDLSLPLDTQVTSDSVGPPARWHVVYTSTHDKRVPALLTLPPGSGPFPAVIVVAGLGGDKRTDYVMATADRLAAIGIATLAVDSEYHGERRLPRRSRSMSFPTSYLNRDATIQTVIDLRRGIDYLETRSDIDASRVGFIGFSQGAMLGTPFCGMEKRVKAVCLVVGGGDFINILPALKDNPLAARLSKIMDPVHFVGMIAPRPLLMLNAKKDELVPRAATDALYNAAREPKEIIWYDAGHVISQDPNRDPFDDMVAFMKKHLSAGK